MAKISRRTDFPAKKLLLGGCGSIAASAIPELVLWMRGVLGIEQVRVMLTRQAVTMVSLRAVSAASSHNPVVDDAQTADATAVPHMHLAQWADVVLIMPATANIIAKVAVGIADDIVSTCILSTTRHVVFVPCMNEVLWNKSVTQRNVAALRRDGYHLINPGLGYSVAEDRIGFGAMAEVGVVMKEVREVLLGKKARAGR